jgi:hypothetical protein
MKMKKEYISPALEDSFVCTMEVIAASLEVLDGEVDDEKDILSRELFDLK